MRAVALEDVRARWRAQRAAHEALVAQFEKLTAARSMDEENAALRDLLGLLMEAQNTSIESAAHLTGVSIGRIEPIEALYLLYHPIIDVDHEEVDPNSTP